MPAHRSIRSLVLEGLMVLFGVLAALLVDEWRQDVAVSHTVEAATVRLNEEVERNLAELVALDSVVTVRLSQLRAIEPSDHPGKGLADLVGMFVGYRV